MRKGCRMAEIKEIVEIEIDRIHPNEWNPNQQSSETFNQLVQEIEEDGFDHPLQVIPCSCELLDGEHYRIIGGEHRWRAVKIMEWEKVPCSVYENWDEETQKLKTVRRNLLTGELNDAKFTKLVNSLTETIPFEDLPPMLGFDSDKEFLRHYIKDKEDRDRSWLDSLMEESKKEIEAVDGLSDILNNIFSEFGETVSQNFMFFSFKGRTHLMVVMESRLYEEVEKMVGFLKESGGNANDYFEEVLKNARNRRDDTKD